MAKNRNTFEKTQRENLKRRKAEEKRAIGADEKMSQPRRPPQNTSPTKTSNRRSIESPKTAPADHAMLTVPEQAVLKVFRDYLVAPGEMLCFTGPSLDKHRASLRQLTAKDLLVEENFAGGYSLTAAGFSAMRRKPDAKSAPR